MPRKTIHGPDKRQHIRLATIKLNVERMKLVKQLHTSSGNFGTSPATKKLIVAKECLLDKVRSNMGKM